MTALSLEAQALWADKSDGGHRHTDEPWLSRYADELLLMLPLGGVLIDVGCGACELTTYLAPHFIRAYGVDFSESMLAAARERLRASGADNLRLLPGDMRSLPAQVEAADVVLSFCVIQYLTLDEVIEHLQECRRVLQKGGIVCIANVPDARRREWYHHNIMSPLRSGPLARVRQMAEISRRRLVARLKGQVIWDDIGNWFAVDEFAEAARRTGYRVEFRNTWYYEYRFHALFHRDGTDV